MKKLIVVAVLLAGSAFGQQVITTVTAWNPLVGVQHYPNQVTADVALPLLLKAMFINCATCESAIPLTQWGRSIHIIDSTATAYLVVVRYEVTDSVGVKQVSNVVLRTGELTSHTIWTGRATNVSFEVSSLVPSGRTSSVKSQ